MQRTTRKPMTQRALALFSMLAGFSDPTRTIHQPAREQRTPEQVAQLKAKAEAKRARKAQFRLNQANQTNYRVRCAAA